MTKLARVLKKIYKKGKYKSGSAFARAIDVQQSTLHVWMAGRRNPSFESIDRLVRNLKKQGFEISKDDLR